MQIELYITQRISKQHDAYYFDVQAIYGHLRRRTENSEIRILVNIQPTQTHTTTYVSTKHSRHKNARCATRIHNKDSETFSDR